MWKLILTILLFIFYSSASAQDNDQIRLANEYYSQGEVEKAVVLFEELSKKAENLPLIHNNYFFLLIERKKYDDARKYLKRITRKYPENYNYKLDEGYLLFQKGEREEADKIFKEIIGDVQANTFQTKMTAEYFVNKRLYSYAVVSLEQARKNVGSPHAYALELANIYRIMNEKDLMVEEYLNYVSSNPSNVNYVKNTLQNLLSTPEELQSLEQLLYNKMQREPDNNIYPELLIWANIQQKNFYGAFIQARALDKRLRLPGSRSMEIGRVALENEDYANAEKIFSYIIKEYTRTNNYLMARMYLIKTNELQIRNTYPVVEEKIRKLIHDYNTFVKEVGINKSTLEAVRNKALLHAFYLDEKDSAVYVLNQVINSPGANPQIVSQSKLDLGDIYLLMGQPWESTLLYSQVEKANNDSPLGYEAKLKNAKLSYYKGDFLLAQEHLDILKEATTREISNDAIALSLLIKDNIAFDSTEAAMRAYANIELLLFQNKTRQAKEAIDSLYNALGQHNLVDELLWLQADIHKKEGNFEFAIDKLDKILQDYGSDILADDAFFEKAEIYERQFGNNERAMELYREFLQKFPGSVYVAEARKRFRKLRGDFDVINPVN
jgi:Tfp pilus assembly protein PilF